MYTVSDKTYFFPSLLFLPLQMWAFLHFPLKKRKKEFALWDQLLPFSSCFGWRRHSDHIFREVKLHLWVFCLLVDTGTTHRKKPKLFLVVSGYQKTDLRVFFLSVSLSLFFFFFFKVLAVLLVPSTYNHRGLCLFPLSPASHLKTQIPTSQTWHPTLPSSHREGCWLPLSALCTSTWSSTPRQK